MSVRKATEQNNVGCELRKNCAWLKNGICTCNSQVNIMHKQFECNKLKYCKPKSNKELEKILKKHANDRPFTCDTIKLIKQYYAEGETVLSIAYTLRRSPNVIRKVLGIVERSK